MCPQASVTRLLAYDPDPLGRSQIREGCLGLSGIRLNLHSTLADCRSDLETSGADALLLGLPMPAPDLAALVDAAQRLSNPPLIVFCGEASAAGAPLPPAWVAKTASGMADLPRVTRRLRPAARLIEDLRQAVSLETELSPILAHLARYGLEALGAARSVAAVESPGAGVLCVHQPDASQSEADRSPGTNAQSGQLPGELFMRLARQENLKGLRRLAVEELLAEDRQAVPADAGSILLLPIRRGDRLYGVLGVERPGREAFEEGEQSVGLALADVVATAIATASELADLRRQSVELSSLFTLGIGLSNELTSDGVVDRLFEHIQRLMDVDTAVIVRRIDPETLHCDLLDFGQRLPSMRVPLGGPTLSGYVIRTGEPLLIGDYDAEADRLPVPGLTAGIETASWLGVPLVVRGETIGAVSVQSQAPHHFGENDLRLLRMVANHAAVSLDNTRLLQSASQRAEQLRLVNEIGRYAVSVLDIQHLVREVAQHILRSFDYYAVSILLLENGALVPRAVARAPDGELIHVGHILTLRERSLIAESARSGQAILVPDITQDARFLPTPELPETRAELTVPLMVGSEVVGILDIQSDQVDRLGPADLEMVQALAAQVAISVVNARLFAEVRSHAAQLEARVTARTAEIRSQKERTEAILRSVADAVVVLDLEGNLLLANPVAQELLSGSQGAEVMSQIRRLHAQGGVVTETLELGPMAFQALASPVTLGDLAVGTVVVLRDISRLRELDRLKSHFVATVSHELRTPLANIKLYLSLLRRGHEQRRGQYVQVLEEETGRLSAMIEDLLDLSRLEAMREVEPGEPVELRGLLRQVMESLRPSFTAKSIDARLEEGPSPVVVGRRDQLIQVFTNLLSNSVQYTPSGGWVRLRIQDGEPGSQPRMASVAVQDGGQGIPEKDLPYIFDRFYRGSLARSSNLPGSGLGLAIVREILDRHQGRITVLSRLGEGSTFTVWLPQGEE